MPAGHQRERQRVVPEGSGPRAPAPVDRLGGAAQSESNRSDRSQTPVTFATNKCRPTQGWTCVCFVFIVCVFLSDNQRGEEREGRSPGDNIHPSTTGAFVGKLAELNERFARL